MQSLSQDNRFFAQVDFPTIPPSPESTWEDEGPVYINVVKTVESILGPSAGLSVSYKFGDVVGLRKLLIYDVLSQILPFPSEQSRFYWKLSCRSFASMLETANYPARAQTIHLTYLFARVIGMMGPNTEPVVPTMLTADGSPCEGSWVGSPMGSRAGLAEPPQVIPTDSSPQGGQPNRQILTGALSDPRTGKFLRGSQVLDYLSSTNGGLGVVLVKDGCMDWRLEIENFLFGSESQGDEDECPSGTGFFLGLSLLPSGHIVLKGYYQPCVAAKDGTSAPLTTSPVYVTSKSFSPLRDLFHSCHPTLVDQLALMLEYIDTVDEELKPQFYLLGFDVVAPSKNCMKVYFQTRAGFSWNDIVRNFTLGGRLNTPELQANLARLEILWNCLFPYAHSQLNSGNIEICSPKVAPRTTNEGYVLVEHDELPLNCLLWCYEFTPHSRSLVPKVCFPAHFCRNELEIYHAIEKFYDHPTVGVSGPPDGENGVGWVVRDMEKSLSAIAPAYPLVSMNFANEYVYNSDHRPLSRAPGLTTWITYGHKHTGYKLTTYYSPEIWLPGS